MKDIGALQVTKNSDDDDNDSDNELVDSEASTSRRNACQSGSNRKKQGWSTFQRPVKVDMLQLVHKQSKSGYSELEESLKHVILVGQV